jgi:hypothetical protein
MMYWGTIFFPDWMKMRCIRFILEREYKDRIKFRINEGCILRKGCDCISVRLLDAGENSKQIEKDLLDKYPNSYTPIGCNKKEGG